MNSLSTMRSPSTWPTATQSFGGTPMSHAKGAFTQPKNFCSVTGAAMPNSSVWGSEMRKFAIATRATKAINMPMTFKDSVMPSFAPRQMASMPFVDSSSNFAVAPPAVSLCSVSGSMILAMSSAAGALITDAVSRCPAETPNDT